MTGDDLTVSGPMTVVRLPDGTLDLVPIVEVEEEDAVVYAREGPYRLLGVCRGGRWWVRRTSLRPTVQASVFGPCRRRPFAPST